MLKKELKKRKMDLMNGEAEQSDDKKKKREDPE